MTTAKPCLVHSQANSNLGLSGPCPRTAPPCAWRQSQVDMTDPALESASHKADLLLTQTRNLSSRARGYNQRVISESDALAEEVVGVSRALKRDLQAARVALQSDDRWEEVVNQLERAQGVLHGNGPAGDLRRYAKTRQPYVLSLLLGPSSNVVALRKDQSQQMKVDYHRFRNRSAYTMFAFAAVLQWGLRRTQALSESRDGVSMAPVLLVGVQLFVCWMLFYYVASALRESVLKLNGSHIRPWWIHHHYWAAGTSCLLLSLPVDSPTFRKAINGFLWWPMLQSVVILTQNRYQRRRMYTRIALGKNSTMDVVAGDGVGAHGQLVFLYPLLFLLQGLQVYLGGVMIKHSYWAMLRTEGYLNLENRDDDLWGNRGFFLAGCLMIFMAWNNFYNTVGSLVGLVAKKSKGGRRVTASVEDDD
ncbi:hypothetical protein ACKKBG_A05185 [Auxenochlorella protothecoides x Auxenochlorella symbiontica]